MSSCECDHPSQRPQIVKIVSNKHHRAMNPSSLSTSIGCADILDKKGLGSRLKFIFTLCLKCNRCKIPCWNDSVIYSCLNIKEKSIMWLSWLSHEVNFSCLRYFLPFPKYFKGLSSETRRRKSGKECQIVFLYTLRTCESPDSDINFNTPKKSTNSGSEKKREPNGILLKTHKNRGREKGTNKHNKRRKFFLEYFFLLFLWLWSESWQMLTG